MPTVPVVESFRFQAETSELLHLMIHSLYTQRDVFLRELISNGSDALDALRFEMLTNAELVKEGHKYEIRIKPDPEARTLTISDTGIGMSRQELIANIGTIARSGTQALRNLIKQSSATEPFEELIGHFGVGFYSAFMVAEKVTLITRRATEAKATRWESKGADSYTLEETEKESWGTDVVLHLKKGDLETGIDEYLQRWKVESIVHKYSDFIAYPIVYEGSDGGARSLGHAEKEVGTENKTLNSMKPIWTRSRLEVNETDYTHFYKHLFNEWDEPLKVLPLKAEGKIDYDALLFIPSKAPYDLFYHNSQPDVRLYANRVMVMEKCEDLLPPYLRFVKGVVDSNNLPLNISRQRLQQEKHIIQIRKWLTRRVLEVLSDLRANEPEKYLKFWSQFGRALKEGVSSDPERREKLVPLLLFQSSHHQEELTTLKEYKERMKPGQTEILYLTGGSRKVIENSPHLEVPRQRGYEVLFLSDSVDELVVQHLYEFEGIRLRSISKGKFNLGNEDEQKQIEEQIGQKEAEYANFLKACQEKLDPYVKQVRLSMRLVGSPSCLVTEEHEYSPHLERLLQKGKGGGAKQRRIMELNSDHPVISRLYGRFLQDHDDSLITESITLLFEMALMAEGSEIADPAKMHQLILDLLMKVV